VFQNGAASRLRLYKISTVAPCLASLRRVAIVADRGDRPHQSDATLDLWQRHADDRAALIRARPRRLIPNLTHARAATRTTGGHRPFPAVVANFASRSCNVLKR
jgi:hypothetical protein